MKRFFRNNGLSIGLAVLFVVFLFCHSVAGYLSHNEDQADHGQPQLTYVGFLTSGEFLESVGENWESEFLQMGAFIMMTRFLFQKGSSESKDPDAPPEEVDEDPKKHKRDKKAPWPVRKGGLVLFLYQHSLSTAFFLLFVISFAMHAAGGWTASNEEQLLHGRSPVTFLHFLTSSKFWYQSFQNWQSEFLAIWCMVFLSIYLREHGSPQSKPVHAPNSDTGE